MEFPFNCNKALGADKEGYAIIDLSNSKKICSNKQAIQIIDALGQLSAKVNVMFALNRLKNLKALSQRVQNC